MIPYARRLKKEWIASRIGDFASFITPRIRRRRCHPQRIGVFAQWGIGDAVLLLPLLRGLRSTYPEASVELIGKPFLDDLFLGEGCCDRTHLLVPPWTAHENKYVSSKWSIHRAQMNALRCHHFDWLISTRFDVRETAQTRLLRASEVFGFQAAGGRSWLTRDYGLDRDAVDARHRSTLSGDMLYAITGSKGDAEIRFREHPALRAAARRWLSERGWRGGPVLAVHSGAGNPVRRWREPHFQSVIGALRIRPSMIVYIDQADVTLSVLVPQASWQGRLSELKALLSLCDVFLGTDSGVMHIAAASGCKIVAPFGPTEPRWFAPSGTGHEIVVNDPMPCRPCFDSCIYPTAHCLENLDQRLISAVDNQLSSVTR